MESIDEVLLALQVALHLTALIVESSGCQELVLSRHISTCLEETAERMSEGQKQIPTARCYH